MDCSWALDRFIPLKSKNKAINLLVGRRGEIVTGRPALGEGL